MNGVEDGGLGVVILKSGVLRLGRFGDHLGGEVANRNEPYHDTVSYSRGRVVALNQWVAPYFSVVSLQDIQFKSYHLNRFSRFLSKSVSKGTYSKMSNKYQ